MGKVNCNAEKCLFNRDNKCCKKHLTICGLYATNKIGTFCNSFKNKNVYSDKIILEDVDIIKCDSNYCSHNKEGFCVFKNINIEGKKASFKSYTECHSFKLKDNYND